MRYHEPIDSLFAVRIAKLADEFETISAFAKAINAHYNTVYFWCIERTMPSAEAIAHICRVRNVSADWLLGLSDDPGRELKQNRRII